MGKSNLRVDWATHEAAKYACERWHYSKCLPVGKLVKIGVWESGNFIGVVIFGRGANQQLGTSYNLKQTECCELVRVAMTKHEAPITKMISLAMRFLKINSPELRLVISFADPAAGHHGGIYQAGNWIYCGTSAKKFDYIGPDGKKYLSRQVSESGFVKQFGKVTAVFKRSDCAAVALPGKHRYLMPLDAEMRRRILPLSKPYPKREQSKDSVAADIQSVEGGATPTCSLTL